MRCPECGAAAEHDARRGEWTCPVCGLVVDADAYAAPAPGAEPVVPRGAPRDLGRLEKLQRQVASPDSSERRWLEARDEVRRLAERLGCPQDVADQAARLIKQARAKGLTQGRSLDAVAAATLQAACRMLQLVRSDEELAAAAKVPASEVNSAYRALVRGLKLPVPNATAHEYMGQLASRLGLAPAIEAKARQILLPVCGNQVAAGKNPRGWAAAGLVLAAREAGQRLSVRAAAEAADVGYSTVRARLADLEALD